MYEYASMKTPQTIYHSKNFIGETLKKLKSYILLNSYYCYCSNKFKHYYNVFFSSKIRLFTSYRLLCPFVSVYYFEGISINLQICLLISGAFMTNMYFIN